MKRALSPELQEEEPPLKVQRTDSPDHPVPSNTAESFTLCPPNQTSEVLSETVLDAHVDVAPSEWSLLDSTSATASLVNQSDVLSNPTSDHANRNPTNSLDESFIPLQQDELSTPPSNLFLEEDILSTPPDRASEYSPPVSPKPSFAESVEVPEATQEISNSEPIQDSEPAPNAEAPSLMTLVDPAVVRVESSGESVPSPSEHHEASTISQEIAATPQLAIHPDSLEEPSIASTLEVSEPAPAANQELQSSVANESDVPSVHELEESPETQTEPARTNELDEVEQNPEVTQTAGEENDKELLADKIDVPTDFMEVDYEMMDEAAPTAPTIKKLSKSAKKKARKGVKLNVNFDPNDNAYLPDAVLEKIFSYTSWQSWRSITTSCRRWRALLFRFAPLSEFRNCLKHFTARVWKLIKTKNFPIAKFISFMSSFDKSHLVPLIIFVTRLIPNYSVGIMPRNLLIYKHEVPKALHRLFRSGLKLFPNKGDKGSFYNDPRAKIKVPLDIESLKKNVPAFNQPVPNYAKVTKASERNLHLEGAQVSILVESALGLVKDRSLIRDYYKNKPMTSSKVARAFLARPDIIRDKQLALIILDNFPSLNLQDAVAVAFGSVHHNNLPLLQRLLESKKLHFTFKSYSALVKASLRAHESILNELIKYKNVERVEDPESILLEVMKLGLSSRPRILTLLLKDSRFPVSVHVITEIAKVVALWKHLLSQKPVLTAFNRQIQVFVQTLDEVYRTNHNVKKHLMAFLQSPSSEIGPLPLHKLIHREVIAFILSLPKYPLDKMSHDDIMLLIREIGFVDSGFRDQISDIAILKKILAFKGPGRDELFQMVADAIMECRIKYLEDIIKKDSSLKKYVVIAKEKRQQPLNSYDQFESYRNNPPPPPTYQRSPIQSSTPRSSYQSPSAPETQTGYFLDYSRRSDQSQAASRDSSRHSSPQTHHYDYRSPINPYSDASGRSRPHDTYYSPPAPAHPPHPHYNTSYNPYDAASRPLYSDPQYPYTPPTPHTPYHASPPAPAAAAAYPYAYPYQQPSQLDDLLKAVQPFAQPPTSAYAPPPASNSSIAVPAETLHRLETLLKSAAAPLQHSAPTPAPAPQSAASNVPVPLDTLQKLLMLTQALRKTH